MNRLPLVTPARLPLCSTCGVSTLCAQSPDTYGPGMHTNGGDVHILWCPSCQRMLTGRSRFSLIRDWTLDEIFRSEVVPPERASELLALGEAKGWRYR